VNLYQEYVKERANLETIWDESFFVSYKIDKDELFISDMFIKKSARGSKLQDVINALIEIAKKNGCKVLSGNIALNDPGNSRTMRAALKVGFRIAAANASAILIIKALEE
jgi:GNAT superfamily N-acetyltransferase